MTILSSLLSGVSPPIPSGVVYSPGNEVPKQVPGLVAWYKGSDIKVTGSLAQINDKSGNGNHRVQNNTNNQPTAGNATVNGKNVISYDQTNPQYTNFTKSLPSNATVFVAYKQENDNIYALMGNGASPVYLPLARTGDNGDPYLGVGTPEMYVRGVLEEPTTRNEMWFDLDTTDDIQIVAFRNVDLSSVTEMPRGSSNIVWSLNGIEAETIIFDNDASPGGVFTVDNLNLIGNYMAEEWGATWTDRLSPQLFLLAGQSNITSRSLGWDSGTDYPDDGSVLQIARSAAPQTSNTDEAVINADRPLDHHTQPGSVSFGLDLQFVLDFRADNPGIEITLLPGGKGGTGFVTGEWGVGEPLSEDLITRANNFLAANPDYKIGGMDWLQGEDETNRPTDPYRTALVAQFNEFRSRITGAENMPIVVGQLADDWNTGSNVEGIKSVIREIPSLINYAAYVDTTGLTTHDGVHFDNASFRTLGSKYYEAYLLAKEAATPFATTAEEGAEGHWLFGDDNTGYTDLVSGQTLTEEGAAPTLNTGYATIASGVNNGLNTGISDNGNITLCAVVRTSSTGNAHVYLGNGRNNVDGVLLFQNNGIRFRTDQLGSNNIRVIETTPSANTWQFIAVSIDSSNNLSWYSKSGSSEEKGTGTLTRGVVSTAETIGIGDTSLNASSVDEGFDIAECMVSHEYNTAAQLEEIYIRSKARLASRQILID